MSWPKKYKLYALVFVVLFLGWLFFYPSERDRFDAEAERLCAIDGGIKIYETVILPSDKFTRDGVPIIPGKEYRNDFNYYQDSRYELLAGKMSSGDGASLKRLVTRYIRASDRKVLAEFTSYTSGGGAMFAGYMHDYGYRCPAISDQRELLKKVFMEGESK